MTKDESDLRAKVTALGYPDGCEYQQRAESLANGAVWVYTADPSAHVRSYSVAVGNPIADRIGPLTADTLKMAFKLTGA